MKHPKAFPSDFRLYGDNVVSMITFSAVVGVLYWLIRLGCDAAFRAIAAN